MVTSAFKLLTIPQVAERLNLSRSSIYNLIDAGILTRVKIGSSVRIYEAVLDAYIQSLVNPTAE